MRIITLLAVLAASVWAQTTSTYDLNRLRKEKIGGATTLTTAGSVPKVTANGTLGESAIKDDGTTVTVTGRNVAIGDTVPVGAPDGSVAVGGNFYGGATKLTFGEDCADATIVTYTAATGTWSCAAASNTPNVVVGATSLDTATWLPVVSGAGTLSIYKTHGGPRLFDNATSPNWLNGWQGNVIDASNGGYTAAVIAGGGTNTSENKLLCTVAGTHCSMSVISGGYDNQMDSAWPSIIAGGAHNRVNMATSGAGFINPVVGYTPNLNTDHGTISGGSYNAIFNSHYGSIGGGTGNAIGHDGTTSDNARIGGGTANTVNGSNSTVAGGTTNHAVGQFIFMGGGTTNTAGSNGVVIGGGSGNNAYGTYASMLGGYQGVLGTVGTPTNTSYSTFGGGYQNKLGATGTSQYAVMLGGRANDAEGDYTSVLGGRACEAKATGAAALCDSSLTTFTNSTANSLGARFSGGYNLSGGATKVVGLTEASTAAKPTCAVGIRGQLYVEKAAAGALDHAFICVKKADDTYAWGEITLTIP